MTYRKTITAVILFVIALCAFPSFSFAQSSDNYKEMKADILRLVNKHRTDMGLGALQMNDDISTGALQHSVEMASKKVAFGHDGFDERIATIMLKVKPANAAAENVAEGAKDADDVVALWLHSKGHRENIEGNYNTTGIGIAKANDGTLYFTQIFIHKK